MPQQKTKRSFQIVAGPSRGDLMLALFRLRDEESSLQFSLYTAGWSGDVVVVLNSVEREDGSGESYCLKGYADLSRLPEAGENARSSQVSFYYHSGRGKGVLEV